jgi:hypothetical protein
MTLRSTMRGLGLMSALAAAPALAEETSYCPDLQHIILLAAGPDKFESIKGKLREGSFHETSRPLSGWHDCAVYGDKTYACNSEDIATADGAEGRLNSTVRQVNACFGEGWWQNDAARTSSLYVVLHHPVGLATMTISTDEDRKNVHVVRLIMFLAR